MANRLYREEAYLEKLELLLRTAKELAACRAQLEALDRRGVPEGSVVFSRPVKRYRRKNGEETVYRYTCEYLYIKGKKYYVSKKHRYPKRPRPGTDENDPENPIFLQNRLDVLEKEFDRLLRMAADEDDSIDEKIRQVSEKIRTIKEKQKELACSEQHARMVQDRAKEVSELLANEDSLTEYSDTLVYRIVEQITVLSKEKIRIRFTGGLELTQKLENVR